MSGSQILFIGLVLSTLQRTQNADTHAQSYPIFQDFLTWHVQNVAEYWETTSCLHELGNHMLFENLLNMDTMAFDCFVKPSATSISTF